MEFRIDTIAEKKLAGKRMRMSLTNNKTSELWRSFMIRRKEIMNQVGSDLYSMQIFDPSYFKNFDPGNEFEKWAAAEVSDFGNVPETMETFTLISGMYAVFLHKGPVSTGPVTFQYIFGTWLPLSGYILDDRPQFEILGEKYKNEDPDSEEEIWIPVKLK